MCAGLYKRYNFNLICRSNIQLYSMRMKHITPVCAYGVCVCVCACVRTHLALQGEPAPPVGGVEQSRDQEEEEQQEGQHHPHDGGGRQLLPAGPRCPLGAHSGGAGQEGHLEPAHVT